MDYTGTSVESWRIIGTEEMTLLRRLDWLLVPRISVWQTWHMKNATKAIFRLKNLAGLTDLKSFVGLYNLFG